MFTLLYKCNVLCFSFYSPVLSAHLGIFANSETTSRWNLIISLISSYFHNGNMTLSNKVRNFNKLLKTIKK